MRLIDFDVLTFDIIGTLIDFESGILNWIRPRVLRAKVEAGDQEMLEAYARAQSAVRKTEPKLNFSGRAPKIWAGIAKEYGIEVQPGDGAAFLASARNWPAFPDSVEALAYLKRNYRHLVAVTNGDRVSVRAMAQTLGSPFFAVITEEDMGVSKPDPKAFDYFLGYIAKLGVPKERVLHVAQSQYHDIGTARKIGLASTWVYRRHGKSGYGGTQTPPEFTKPDFLVTSLAGLVTLHEEDLRT